MVEKNIGENDFEQQVLESRESIQTAEQIVKRRKRLSKIVRRSLLATLACILLIVACVYFFDQYKPVQASSEEEYSKEYWSTLPGFKHYEQWYAELVETCDINSSKYVSPYQEGYDLIQKLNASRYQEEMNLILSPLQTQLTAIEREINEITSNIFGYVEGQENNTDIYTWLCYILLGSGYQTEESAKAFEAFNLLGIDEATFNEKLVNGELSYAYVISQGYTSGESDSFVSYLNIMLREANRDDTPAIFTNRYEWVIRMAGLESEQVVGTDIYQTYVTNGYTGTMEQFYNNALYGGSAYSRLGSSTLNINQFQFASMLYHDLGHEGGLSVFKRATTVTNPDALQQLIAQREDLKKIIEPAEEQYESLLRWTDYIRADNGAMGFKKVATEGNYEFWLNFALTTFKVVDNSDPNNPVEWYSNPTNINLISEPEKADVFKIRYGTGSSSLGSYGTYAYSTSTSFRNNSQGVTPNYAIKIFESEDEESTVIQVWYCLEERGINYTYFPKYLSYEKVQELLERNRALVEEGAEYEPNQKVQLLSEIVDRYGISAYSRLFEGSIYKIVNETNANNQFGGVRYYEYSGNMSNLSSINMSTMYLLYQHCGFTLEDLEEQNDYFQGIATEMGSDITISSGVPSTASFTAAIQYELSADGLKVTVPNAAITETGKSLVVQMDLLEYFTAAESGTEGYTIIPDGSGAILNHDNGKNIGYTPFTKRLYTTDMANVSMVKGIETNDIMLPMYAVVNTGIKTGVIADVIKGAAQLELRADVSGRTDNFNKNYFRIYFRESQSIRVATYSNPVTKYNTNRMLSDISIDYRFLETAVVNEGYSGVAKAYRDILVERYEMQDKKDETDEILVDIDVIGSYQYKNNFLGIVYNDKETLTTYEQLKEIVSEIQGCGVDNVNVFYFGWRDSTLVNESFKSMKAFNQLGKLTELAEINDMENVTVYPYINFTSIDKYQETFGKYHYNTRNIVGDFIQTWRYELETNAWPNGTANAINILSPRYYDAFMDSLIDSYTKLFKIGKDKEVLANISLEGVGSYLTGDYQSNKEMYKVDAVNEQIKILQALKDNNIDNINLYRPYDFAFKYITNAKNIPYQSTQYELLDYSIPFYQLIVNGLFDYSGESINANSEDGTTAHIMHVLETGSNLSFTFTYGSSKELLTTDYNYYYYTHYIEWLEDVKFVCDSVKATGIEGCQLVKHEYLSEGIYKVTYQNKTNNQTVEIILNYSRTAYIDFSAGISVPAKSYKVL